MNLVAALILGHLIADFPLQTTAIYGLKLKSWKGVIIHAFIHVLITALLIDPTVTALPLLLTLGLLHFVVDYLKVRVTVSRQWSSFVIDQITHLLILFLLAHQWQAVLNSVLPFSLLLPLIIYTMFLGLLVFLWVLAGDLAEGQWGKYKWVQWARQNLLNLSQYAGMPVWVLIVQYCCRSRMGIRTAE